MTTIEPPPSTRKRNRQQQSTVDTPSCVSTAQSTSQPQPPSRPTRLGRTSTINGSSARLTGNKELEGIVLDAFARACEWKLGGHEQKVA